MRATRRTGAAVRALVAVTALVAMAAVVAGCGLGGPTKAASGRRAITIGSESYPEDGVLAYVYADALKAAGFSVSMRNKLGSRRVVHVYLDNGTIDMSPEYLGSALDYLRPSTPELSAAAAAATLAPLVAKKRLTLGTYSPAADTAAVAVTQANARKYHLKSIGDLRRVARHWAFGGPPECATRITCVPGLKKYYGVTFKAFEIVDEDGPATVSALKSGAVQAARIFSSDASVAHDHFFVLADPKHFQGAGNVVPVIRDAKATPEAMKVLDQVSAALTTADLISFNVGLQIKHESPSAIAQSFVTAHRLG